MATIPDTTLLRIKRRTFLIGSVYLAACTTVLASEPLAATAVEPAALHNDPYGSGLYGQGAFSGRSDDTVYLPAVAKEDN